MVGNVVGEPFKKYVNDQIKTRQEVYGSGFNSLRDQQHINYLNSKLSWVKMASSVLINPPRDGERANIEQAIITGTSGEEGLNRLKLLGIENPENFLGYKLASSSILFNGLQQANLSPKINEDADGKPINEDPTIADKFNKWQERSGYSKNNSIWNSNKAYGLGGLDFGFQPMPGITGVEINHVNRGSIKKATITLKAYNKFQFELIDLLYLRLGFSMLVEWGNSHYIESDGDNPNKKINIGDITTVGATLTEQFWFQSKGASPLEMSEEIEKYRKKYDSNYDAMFGKVTNFNWSYNNDGSYDITIQLISLGDVVESFKINTLPNPDNNLLTEDEANKDQISLLLYKKRIEIGRFQNNDPDFKYILNPSANQQATSENITNADRIQLLKNTFTNFFGSTDISSLTNVNVAKIGYYVRFGALLDFIKDHILTQYKGKDSKPYPIVDINTNSFGNVMAIFPNQISIDPRICVTNTNFFDPPITQNNPLLGSLLPFSVQNPVPHGKLMNIYLSFNFIEKILETNLDKKGDLSLFNFIKSICDGINKSLGSVNNLEPIIDDETNILTIIDQTQFAGRDELRKFISSTISKVGSQDSEVAKFNNNLEQIEEIEEPSIPFNIYGYNLTSKETPTSNFIKSYSFTTEISPDLANTITIGATANGNVVGEDATSFTKWNKGLTDKFKVLASNPPPSKLNPDFKSSEESNVSNNSSIIDPTLTVGTSSFDKVTITESKEQLQISNYRDYYLPYILGKNFKGEKRIPGNITELGEYFKYNDEIIQRGFTAFKGYFSDLKNKNKEYTTGTIGFIPINLQLELDGLSGIKVYQKLKVDINFLPSNYPNTLEFLVKQVNHEIKDNKWITKLETISVPKVQKIPIINKTEVEGLSTIEDTSNLIFYSPINDRITGDNLSNVIRNDIEGAGKYGANREGGKLHNGLDLLTRGAYNGTVNYNTFFAPISGNVYITKATNASKTSGVRIEGTGKYTGYIAYIFYIIPNITSGQAITLGDPVGEYQDLSLDYSDKVKDHIHFQLKVIKNGKEYYIDPTTLNYTFDVTLGNPVNGTPS